MAALYLSGEIPRARPPNLPNMTDPNRPQRYIVQAELELFVTDPEALQAAALAHLNDPDISFTDPQEKIDQEKSIRSDLGEAIDFLFDVGAGLDRIDGVEFDSSSWSTREARTEELTSPAEHEAALARDAERKIEEFIADAQHIRGIDFAFESDHTEADPPASEEAARDERQTLLIKGLLWHACKLIIDHAFIDMANLAENEEPLEDTIDFAWTFGGLPPRFAAHYNTGFQRRFTVALIEVSERLAVGWRPLPTMAHELALRLFLDQVEASAQLWNVNLEKPWREILELYLFEDTDHAYLYNTVTPGYENGPSFERDQPTSVDHWFEPYAERPISAYLDPH